MSDFPIIINNFNRLSTTRKLVEDLNNLGYINVHILDNNSTYPKLLEWYDSNSCIVKRLSENMQWLAIYNSGYINEFLNKYPWVVYTDSDIELNPLTPPGFVEKIVHLLEKYNRTKGGLALRIEDLPNNEYANHYREWESKYWLNRMEEDVYDAHIDTTFCVIKPGVAFDYQALRVGGNMTAKHVPWYADFDNLDEEELYYITHSSDWSTYKRFYNQIKNQCTAGT